MLFGETVLVTGANGFIGQNVVARLCQDGWAVKGTVRSFYNGPACSNLSLTMTGDLAEFTDFDALLKNCSAVIHLAARAHKGGHQRLFDRANIDVTTKLAEAAVAHGVQRFIYISSAGVMGNLTSRAVSEADEPNPESPYAASKYHSELKLREITENSSISTVILRPTLVYGEHNPGNMGRLGRLIKTRIPLPFAGIQNSRDFLHIDHLTDIISAALSRNDIKKDQTFLVSDGVPLSTPELIRYLSEGMRIKVRMVAVPQTLLLSIAKFPMLGSVEKLTESFNVDCSLKRAVFGSLSRDEVIRRVIAVGQAMAS